jgi:hypothetical protein
MLPKPRPGLVIRSSYLWHRESEAGHEDGLKVRPCAIVVAVERGKGATLVRVLPITHTAPDDPESALEIPQATKRRLGLDMDRSWIVLDDANDFVWPGPDMSPLRKADLSTVALGMLPPNFIPIVRDKFKARFLLAKTKTVRRNG